MNIYYHKSIGNKHPVYVIQSDIDWCHDQFMPKDKFGDRDIWP